MTLHALSRGVSILARELLIVLVTALLGVLVYRAVAKKTPAPVDNAYLETVRLELTSKPLLRLGLTIQAQEDAFLERRSLLLITSPACEFCVASSTFHNRLLTLARAQNVAFYIAAPKLDRAREYLRSATLDQAKLLNWSNLSLKSRGTPTIALIESGIIRKLWVRRLEADLESQVSDSILHSGVPLSIPDYLPSGYANIAATKLQAQFGARPISIVDIRNRSEFKDGHLPNAVNIPWGELEMRVEHELRRDHMQIVDCSTLTRSECVRALGHLKERGFNVAALEGS